MSAIAARVRADAEPMCGTTSARGADSSAWSAGSGSGSVTSRAAPPTEPDSSASTSASVSTISPRAVLISTACRRISASSRAPIILRVASVSGVCSDTKSDRRRTSSSGAARVCRTVIPKPPARRASACPIRP